MVVRFSLTGKLPGQKLRARAICVKDGQSFHMFPLNHINSCNLIKPSYPAAHPLFQTIHSYRARHSSYLRIRQFFKTSLQFPGDHSFSSHFRDPKRAIQLLKMPSFTVGAELPASAQKVCQSIKDAPLIIPKIAPHAVASIEHVDGPAEGVGSVRLTKFGSVAPAGAFVKEKLVAFDPTVFSATTEEVEGGHLAQGFTKWVSNLKITPITDSSCQWETIVEYEGGDDATVGMAIARAKEGLSKMMNGLCAYINSSA